MASALYSVSTGGRCAATAAARRNAQLAGRDRAALSQPQPAQLPRGQPLRLVCQATIDTILPAHSLTDNAESKNKIPLNDVKINDVEPAVEAVKEKSAKGGLSPAQVHSLLTTICQETEFMEANIKIGAFKMFVKRRGSGAIAATEAVAALAAPSAPPVATAPVPGPTSAPTQEDEDYQDEFGDEGLVPVTAGRVGVVRRGRVFKGKAGKPVVNVGDTVKKGQTICFIEQLGTHMPVESPLAGEVVNFPVEDADPVEFGQILVQLRPDFPGIKSRR